MITPHSSAPWIDRMEKMMPPSAPCAAATATLPLTVARTTVVNLRNRCCLCVSPNGTARRRRADSCGPSRSRKNSRYIMMPKLITNWNVSWPMFRAWVARNWLACIAPALSLSCRLGMSATSKRASTSCTDGGSAAIACWK
ncbi:hypothetical protein D3C72_1615770 [compost metagenome]